MHWCHTRMFCLQNLDSQEEHERVSRKGNQMRWKVRQYNLVDHSLNSLNGRIESILETALNSKQEIISVTTIATGSAIGYIEYYATIFYKEEGQ